MKKKMGQAGVCSPAPSYFTGGLVVQLQGKLDIPWVLRAGDLTHGRSKVHVWSVQVDVVEGIDEVGSELQSEPLCELEVLLQAQVEVRVSGPRNQPS
jgi:hypothetical protein